MKPIRTVLVGTMALGIGWFGFGAQHASVALAATPPPTLTGEFFGGISTGNANSIHCNADGSGSFTFEATGTATGPYTGPFTETGSAIITPAALVTSFTASFTIVSPLGTVTGTKTLTANAFADGVCRVQQAAGIFVTSADYTASIATPNGTYTDRGTSEVGILTVGEFGNNVLATPDTSVIQESFQSALTQTVAPEPTNKEQCKDGGYATYTDPSTGQPFKNQGRCVSYVEHTQH